MQRLISFSSLFLGVFFAVGPTPRLLAAEPVLESYSIGQGGDRSSGPDLFEATLSDKSFGNGTAKSQVKLTGKEANASLSLLVYRSVTPGEVVFALLVFKVEIRAYDSAGAPIYMRDLGGFTFGDSQGGVWTQEIEDLPSIAKKVQVTFIGNYE